MPKIAIIGAGSAEFSTEIIRDVLATPALEHGTFALVDVHAGRLELARQAAEKLVDQSGRNWTVEASLDRRDILPGTNYVVNTIEVAGRENVRAQRLSSVFGSVSSTATWTTSPACSTVPVTIASTLRSFAIRLAGRVEPR